MLQRQLTLSDELLSAYFYLLTFNLHLMAAEVLTTDDLREFKSDLLADLKELLSSSSPTQKTWLKSADVKKMLGISSGTLANLRVNGTIPYSKVGGVIFYDYNEIAQVIENNKVNHHY